MGLKTSYLIHFFSACDASGIEDFKHIKMCEFGNQVLKFNDITLQIYLDAIEVKGDPKTGKELFMGLGCQQHFSIDLNGLDGAKVLDLGKPIADPAILGKFDIVTSFGTLEHIEEQYFAIRNVERLLKVGGIFYAILPAAGMLEGHGKWAYTRECFLMLAEERNYKWIIEPEVREGVHPKCISLCWQKVSTGDFISRRLYDEEIASEVIPNGKKKNS